MRYDVTRTTCPYCGCGCQMLLEAMDGKLVSTMPLKETDMNGGKLCIKGLNAHEFVHSKDRLTRPLIRENGRLKETDWDTALDTIVSGFSRIKEQHGSDSLAFFSSARCTNEENFLLQKLSRAGFGTNNVDHCARL